MYTNQILYQQSLRLASAATKPWDQNKNLKTHTHISAQHQAHYQQAFGKISGRSITTIKMTNCLCSTLAPVFGCLDRWGRTQFFFQATFRPERPIKPAQQPVRLLHRVPWPFYSISIRPCFVRVLSRGLSRTNIFIIINHACNQRVEADPSSTVRDTPQPNAHPAPKNGDQCDSPIRDGAKHVTRCAGRLAQPRLEECLCLWESLPRIVVDHTTVGGRGIKEEERTSLPPSVL